MKVYRLLPWTASSALCGWCSSTSMSFFKLVDSFGVIVIDYLQKYMLVMFSGREVSYNNLPLSAVDTNVLLGIPLTNVPARFKLLCEGMDHVAILQPDKPKNEHNSFRGSTLICLDRYDHAFIPVHCRCNMQYLPGG